MIEISPTGRDSYLRSTPSIFHSHTKCQSRKETYEGKLAPRYAQHVRYGTAEIVAVRELGSSGLVADVTFPDGTERTIRPAPEYWISDIQPLAPAEHDPARARRNVKAS
jgi:hypothetical protein